MPDLKENVEGALDKMSEISETLTARSPHVNRRTFIIVGVVTVLVALSYFLFVRAPSGFPAGKLVEVPEGLSLTEIADLLKKEHVIRSSLALRAFIILTGDERGVHFGDYLFKEPKNVFSVARAIAIGAYGLEPTRFLVPEGTTVKEIADIFGNSLERFNKERFISSAKDMEGYLFPDTYFFLPNANDDLILRTMRQNFDEKIVDLKDEIEKSGRSLEDIIIMASILEREANIFEDRRMIAGVLWKRLDKKMLLQVDATFLYTLGKGTFDLTNADLKSSDPYNTYVHKGLPPTPIGSPSLAAIEAAATPIKSEYFFYLADRNFVTHYSKTYQEHLEKKRQYLGG